MRRSTVVAVTWVERPDELERVGYARKTAAQYDEIREKIEKEIANGGPRRRPLRFTPGAVARCPESFYRSSDGRTWEEVDPEPRVQDFGGPSYVPWPRLNRDHCAPRRRLTARQVRDDAEALAALRIADAAYTAAWDAWRMTDEYAAYVAARDRYFVRRAQFAWTGRGRQDAEILEMTTSRR